MKNEQILQNSGGSIFKGFCIDADKEIQMSYRDQDRSGIVVFDGYYKVGFDRIGRVVINKVKMADQKGRESVNDKRLFFIEAVAKNEDNPFLSLTMTKGVTIISGDVDTMNSFWVYYRVVRFKLKVIMSLNSELMFYSLDGTTKVNTSKKPGQPTCLETHAVVSNVLGVNLAGDASLTKGPTLMQTNMGCGNHRDDRRIFNIDQKREFLEFSEKRGLVTWF